MRILIVHTTLWTHYKARIYSALFQSLSNKNTPSDLLVVHLAVSERSRASLGGPDDSIHQYPYQVISPGSIEDMPFKARFEGVLKAIRDFKPDVINLTGYFDPAMLLLFPILKLKGIKIILSIDSTQSDNHRQSYKESFKKLIIRQADGFFCYGSLAAEYMLSLGARPEQILSRKNSIDIAVYQQLYEQALQNREETLYKENLPQKNIIFVGRLIDRLKNISTLLTAFKKAKETPNASHWGLLIVGDGEDSDALKEKVRQLAIPHVNFRPGVSWNQIPAYLALADVLVLPSYSEPWGLVVNEAMACGLPVLVSNRCGCAPDLVQEGENGYTFDPYKEEELAGLLAKCFAEEHHLGAMGTVSRQMIAPYSPENVADEMADGFLGIQRKSGVQSARLVDSH
ncbi:glycosyltransferase family 4 protein [Tellurirhabdus bombi]|uniref:glycosyltransferase family 4 protein n=1 Tax=Tellurirhabdus bombi TaxID=2907205 RepID=UPI001F41340E|nr:glycosyltransferase family 4 protein [Tellurirhabdus bombi]